MKKAPLHLALLVAAGCLVSWTAAAQPIGAIDEPTAGQRVSGVVRVSGFVLDFNRVSKVELFIDGNSLPTNSADLNLPRPDVLNVFPTYVNSATPRPGYLTSFYTRTLTNGPHSINVRVTEASGAQFSLGPVSVIVDNSVNQAPFGYIDQPTPGVTESATGSYPIVGWALDDQGIDHIDFLVDNQIVAGAIGRLGDVRIYAQTALYGSTRPDVAAAFPDVPFAVFSGFLANVDTTKLINGMHVFSVRVTDASGTASVIGTRTVQVINNGSNLAPFGRIDFPLDKASLNCQPAFDIVPPPTVCPSPCFPPGPPGTPALPVSFYSNFVRGWALDTGSRLDRGQVAYVELLLDGVPIINTRRDCVVLGTALLNCYGVNRPDVARLYSGYVNADNAGFSFAFALQQNVTGTLSVLIPFAGGGPQLVGLTNSGKHTLALRVGDDEATVIQIGAMSVDVLCDLSTTPDRPAFGYIDQPVEYQFINNTFLVTGWADDFDFGISRLEVDVDGRVLAILDAPSGTYGIERPDVPANDIRVASRFVGFIYPMDTTRMTDTEHDLVIYAFDNQAPPRRSEIGRRKFVVVNNSPIKR